MPEFLTDLEIELVSADDNIWQLTAPLKYWSNLIRGRVITVPAGFQTDLASVPRLPFLYLLWGGKAHREGVLHDYLYRIDSKPRVSFARANRVFLEAMKCRCKPWWVRYPMFVGVALGGRWSYHKKITADRLTRPQEA